MCSWCPPPRGRGNPPHRLVERVPVLVFFTSVTTRPARSGAVKREDYFFVDDEKFEAMV